MDSTLWQEGFEQFNEHLEVDRFWVHPSPPPGMVVTARRYSSGLTEITIRRIIEKPGRGEGGVEKPT